MFRLGESGNPKGWPPGTAMQAKLKEAVGPRFHELVQTIMQSALAGDMTAAALLLNRLVPAVRPAQEPTPFPLTGDSLSDKAHGLLAAAADGQLAATDAKLMLDALVTVAKLHEIEELEQRMRHWRVSVALAHRLEKLEGRWLEARITVPAWRAREILTEVTRRHLPMKCSLIFAASWQNAYAAAI